MDDLFSLLRHTNYIYNLYDEIFTQPNLQLYSVQFITFDRTIRKYQLNNTLPYILLLIFYPHELFFYSGTFVDLPSNLSVSSNRKIR